MQVPPLASIGGTQGMIVQGGPASIASLQIPAPSASLMEPSAALASLFDP
ncbi:MAG TPA: hypothetical protein VF765_11770 [Polyangiaceae bacterium]